MEISERAVIITCFLILFDSISAFIPTMIEEVVTLRIDSVWDFTGKKIEEYESIDRNFVVRKEFYNVLYCINNQPVCMGSFKFLDDMNLIIQDYSYGETNMIGPMLKEILMRTRNKFPDVNMYILIDESGNGKPYEALRKDRIISILQDMYYSVEFGRNPLFDSEQPIEILVDNRIRTLWAFDGNVKNIYTMKMFIQKQQEIIEEVNAKRNKEFANIQEESIQPLLTPPINSQPRQPLLLSEVSPAPADEKETQRIKKKSRKEVAFEDSFFKSLDSIPEKINAQPKPKSRGRPPKTN